MIYTDGIHLIGDSLEELHRFAREIVLSKSWFHNPRGKNKPHYDILCPFKLDLAIRKGARLVHSKKIVKILQEKFGKY